MRNILITGSNGFIGRSLVNYFLDKGDYVIGIDISSGSENKIDLKRYQFFCFELPSSELKSILERFLPEIIIHAAGSSSVPDSIINPEIDFQKSIVSLHSILEGARKFSANSLIVFTSSAAVYGNVNELPISEDSQINPISPYGYHKYLCELLLDEYYKIYSIKSSILRLYSIYSHGLKNRIFWDVCLKAKESKTITLFGTGDETRDYIHIKDFLQVVSLIIEKGEHNASRYNVANGIEVSTKELATKLITNLGKGNELNFNEIVREGDPIRWVADLQKVKKLGYKQTLSINEGLHQYADWFKSIVNDI
jgi:UDP-glucose 4-epimerase